MKKRLRPLFSHTTELGRPQGTLYRIQQGISTFIVQVSKLFLQDIRGRWKQIFPKRLSSRWKTLLAIFFSFYRVWQISGISLLGSTSYFDNYFGNNKITFLGHKRSIETNISKISSFHDDKCFWHIFFVLSGVANVREPFIRVHKVIRKLLCEWYDHSFGT